MWFVVLVGRKEASPQPMALGGGGGLRDDFSCPSITAPQGPGVQYPGSPCLQSRITSPPSLLQLSDFWEISFAFLYFPGCRKGLGHKASSYRAPFFIGLSIILQGHCQSPP